LRELNVSLHEDGKALVSPFRGKGRFCKGDSGGPVICLSDEKEYVPVGIISFSEGLPKELKPQCYGDVILSTAFQDMRIAVVVGHSGHGLWPKKFCFEGGRREEQHHLLRMYRDSQR
uniref:Peptidase S1 domain-containing protein n=1 Tax=Toxocara canis TaxID=6265 RepID=A0A183VCL6_TOXCA